MTKKSLLDQELSAHLDIMLAADAQITARSVARAMSVSASTITRVGPRRALLERYQVEQRRLRAIASRSSPASRERLIQQIAIRDAKITELERKVQFLTAAQKAVLIAIGEQGGTAAWQRFFQDYERIMRNVMGDD